MDALLRYPPALLRRRRPLRKIAKTSSPKIMLVGFLCDSSAAANGKAIESCLRSCVNQFIYPSSSSWLQSDSLRLRVCGLTFSLLSTIEILVRINHFNPLHSTFDAPIPIALFSGQVLTSHAILLL